MGARNLPMNESVFVFYKYIQMAYSSLRVRKSFNTLLNFSLFIPVILHFYVIFDGRKISPVSQANYSFFYDRGATFPPVLMNSTDVTCLAISINLALMSCNSLIIFWYFSTISSLDRHW